MFFIDVFILSYCSLIFYFRKCRRTYWSTQWTIVRKYLGNYPFKGSKVIGV